MTIAIPVIDQHELTQECLDHLAATAPNISAVIVDNDSEEPYYQSDWDVEVIKNTENRGYYYPLLQVAHDTTDNVVGLIHNDLFVYEPGWDKRIEDAFAADPQLMLIGFCGSDQVDERGGRGSGTMSNFAGTRGQLQAHTGRQITDLRPALLLDSLAMIFRREAIPLLEIDEDIVPCHFYDKIWSLRIVDKGYRVGVMGISVDHVGGQTSVAVPKYNKDAEAWCTEHGLPFNPSDQGSAAHEIYLHAERRMFREFGPKGLIPSRIDQDWRVHRHIGTPKYPNGV